MRSRVVGGSRYAGAAVSLAQLALSALVLQCAAYGQEPKETMAFHASLAVPLAENAPTPTKKGR
jgi:hypothetical protein